jgi:hypothetical protein
MKVVTLIVLDDGTEIRLEAKQAGFLGLQCQHCFTTYELAAELTGPQAHEVAALYNQHVESCRAAKRVLPMRRLS